MNTPEPSSAPDSVKVWDPLVRIFHWSLVAAFTVAYFTGDEESQIHVYAGYAVIGLVLFRIVWGLIGTRHARFWDFVYRPSAIMQYAREFFIGRPKRYLGHNPLGGAMILLLLGSLLTTGVTGYLMLGSDGEDGVQAETTITPAPATARASGGIIASAYADDDEGEEGGHDENEGPLKEVHEFFANFTLFLVFLHVGGVLLSSLRHRENLVRAMVTGRKPA
jgi:cytochrome b